jgi:hypothetical protein
VYCWINSYSEYFKNPAISVISFSPTLTKPGHRQQLVQRWQR